VSEPTARIRPNGAPPRILLLGGTGEASQLAATLSTRTDLALISSLAGRTRHPALPPGMVRVGGFGGVAGLAFYLMQQEITAVIDATHPYAAKISSNAEHACAALRVPLIALERPPWQPQPGDRWTAVRDAQEAASVVDHSGARVLLTIGRQEVGAFAGCERAWFLVRSIDPPQEKLPPNSRLILARGPFSLDAELELLQSETINWMVSKNSGGAATYSKIAAARALGIPVVMLDRPQKHTIPACTTCAEVLQKLAELCG
jgi:precorrin-6A/cobalt-precorrin-6A reductase